MLLGHRGVGRTERRHCGLDQSRGDRRLDAELTRPSHRPPDDPSQHVATTLVRRQDAVGHQHRHRPPVIGHDSKPHVGLLVTAVGVAGDRRRRLDHREEGVGRKDRVDALEDRQDPLEPGARVDTRTRQGLGGAVGVAVVLHEHQVPDLDVALRAAVRRTSRLAVTIALVEVELRARAAWAGVAHLPEVVLAHALDALGGHPDLVTPDLFGLVVALVHGDPQQVAVYAELPGDQLPRKGDGVRLEVVAEAEVPEHLEEGAVPVGGADDFDVEGAKALLHRGGPRPRRGLVAHEEGLEGHHARDGEEHRRIVRDEAGRRDRDVAPLGEEADERLAQVVGVARRGLGHDSRS